jgi:HAD superfamily hydrolase (TIGR01450 family)
MKATAPAAPLWSQPLAAAPRPLVDLFDTGLFDLDGVVYVGKDPVPGGPQALERARSGGMRVAFITNNAARTPDTVVAHLRAIGVAASVGDVVTSAQAGAGLLAQQLSPGTRVLVVGGDGLVEALRERGFVPVSSSDQAAAVIQGFHPEVGWKQLAEGAYALRTGVPWVATNVDVTLPTERGLAPGNGALVEVLRLATGRSPVVAGKPKPPLFTEAATRTGADRPLVIGDRLDTDIEVARAAGMPSLAVLTGVTTLADLVTAPPERRPTYVARDLGGLFVPHPSPTLHDDRAICGGWTVVLEPSAGGTEQAVVAGDGDPLDAARALLAAVWSRPDPTTVDASHAVQHLHRELHRIG